MRLGDWGEESEARGTGPPLARQAAPLESHHLEPSSYQGCCGAKTPEFLRVQPPEKISSRRRLVLILVSTVMCCLTTGIVFGFAALKSMLIADGVYHDLCEVADTSSALSSASSFAGSLLGQLPPMPSMTTAGGLIMKSLLPLVSGSAGSSASSSLDGSGPCTAQILRIDLMFTIASFGTNGISPIVGFILDRYGPRLSLMISSVCIAVALVLFSASSSNPAFDMYHFSSFLLAVGGTFATIPLMGICNAFPKRSGLIISCFSGAFDISALIFLIFQLLYQHANVAISDLFLGYLIVPAIMVVFYGTQMPDSTFKASQLPPDTLKSLEAELESDDHDSSPLPEPKPAAPVNNADSAMHNMTAFQQIFSLRFLFLALFTCIYFFRLNFFIQTVEDHVRELGYSETDTVFITQVFSIMLPLGGIIATPLTGWMLDHLPFYVTFLSISGSLLLFSVLILIPSLPLHYLAYAIFSVVRPMFYGSFTDYVSRVFGFRHFGKVYGVLAFLGALMSLAQYLFSYWGNTAPSGFLGPNIFFLVTMVASLYFPAQLYFRHRELRDAAASATDESVAMVTLQHYDDDDDNGSPRLGALAAATAGFALDHDDDYDDDDIFADSPTDDFLPSDVR
ncbi:hypothetical protein H696_05371 [Fonticula alba]|uniref:Major facilitator superfamily (MFS) profile domain-containing protein n=1 Tax=Fonticula alba TaxID=691883 RepID=A0A058Z1I0_FONAL|nr:hypothetical protein H696_05371 [Fonticula alba]KCV68115.1 hypothetical protein H696_05371 [Fonticula alba]|eukprot:XP_009497489.1 hypothetical protein H696_05371 [Fonticula alba]